MNNSGITFFENLYSKFKILVYILFILFIGFPLGFLIKDKKKNSIAFIGRDLGNFTDSIKYLFLYIHSLKLKNIDIYFITQDPEMYKLLKSKEMPVIKYPSINGAIRLLKSSVVVVDNWMWIYDLKYQFLYNCKKIQIWHGIPLKKIQLNNPKNLDKLKGFISRTLCRIIGLFPHYDAIVSTSEFYTKHAFSNAFNAKEIIETGYPRNDTFFNDIEEYQINTDIKTILECSELKKDGFKIIIYAPTFRDTGGNAFNTNSIDLVKLNKFAVENKFLFICKFHPDPLFFEKMESIKIGNNIKFYENSCDVYPFLKITDCLITDYSSIFYDYLLLNKPIVFYPFDYGKYISEDREFIFEYESSTPGPKCYNQEELEKELINCLINNNDKYSSDRVDLLNKCFKNPDGKSSERIWNYINEKFIMD